MFVEKAFGVLKRRFPALKHGLRLRKPQDICLLILCAFVLHNMCIQYKKDGFDSIIDGPLVGEEIEVFPTQRSEIDDTEEGFDKRIRIAQNL